MNGFSSHAIKWNSAFLYRWSQMRLAYRYYKSLNRPKVHLKRKEFVISGYEDRQHKDPWIKGLSTDRRKGHGKA